MLSPVGKLVSCKIDFLHSVKRPAPPFAMVETKKTRANSFLGRSLDFRIHRCFDLEPALQQALVSILGLEIPSYFLGEIGSQ